MPTSWYHSSKKLLINNATNKLHCRDERHCRFGIWTSMVLLPDNEKCMCFMIIKINLWRMLRIGNVLFFNVLISTFFSFSLKHRTLLWFCSYCRASYLHRDSSKFVCSDFLNGPPKWNALVFPDCRWFYKCDLIILG